MNQEIIFSNNFAENCDLIFSQSVSEEQFNTFSSQNKKIIFKTINDQFSSITFSLDTFTLYENDLVYCHSDLLEEFFLKVRECKFKNIKLISNQSDRIIQNNLYRKKPSCISTWYAININIDRDDLIPIPLGLSNPFSKKNLSFNDFDNPFDNNNFEQKKHALYINFNKNTNYKERTKLYEKFENKEWSIIKNPVLNNEDYKKDLSEYKFVLCPWGNGIDTHRIYESLYSGCIPIIKKHKTYNNLEGLPILFVNSYDEINLDLLNEFSSNLNLEEINIEKLNINWWINKIRQTEISSTNIKFTSKPKKIQTMYLVNKLKLKYKIKSLNKKLYFFYVRVLNKLTIN